MPGTTPRTTPSATPKCSPKRPLPHAPLLRGCIRGEVTHQVDVGMDLYRKKSPSLESEQLLYDQDRKGQGKSTSVNSSSHTCRKMLGTTCHY